MRRALALFVATLLAGTGCVPVNRETRVEKGPTLRSYERQVPLEGGGVMAQVDAKWPTVTLAFTRFERCRNERVEEVLEERITDSFAPSAGPAFALGVTGTAVGAGLLAFRGQFSDEPNRRYIDETGHYGATPRTVATTWSVVLLSVGVPALVTGIVGLAQSGQQVQSRKVEQVASALEATCHQTPVDGEVELAPLDEENAQPMVLKTEGGKVTLNAQQLREFRLASVQFDGAMVLLPKEESDELEAFLACNQVLPPPAPEQLAALSETELVNAFNAARQCGTVLGQQGAAAIDVIRAEIQRRRQQGIPLSAEQAPRFHSMEEAMKAWPPTLRLAEGSADLPKLANPDQLTGQVARIEGTVSSGPSPDVVELTVGPQRVRLSLPPEAPWASVLEVGKAVDALGVVVGRQTETPDSPATIRAIWIQQAL